MSASENDLGIFKNLEMIPEMLEKIQLMELEINNLKESLIPKLDLTKRADVLKYLGISNSKLDSMLKDGRLKQGIHFTKEIKGKRNKINFISSAVVRHKEKK